MIIFYPPRLGALAGNPFGVDRQFIARELGFIGGVCPNSMDAVSDRDYVLDTLYFVALHMTHLSRWAEDLIIYSSGLFKFVQCSDAYATGAPCMHARPALRAAMSLMLHRATTCMPGPFIYLPVHCNSHDCFARMLFRSVEFFFLGLPLCICNACTMNLQRVERVVCSFAYCPRGQLARLS